MELYQYIIIMVVLLIIALAIVKMNKKNIKLEFNKLVDLLGGKDNILDTEVEMSRFKVTLKDITKANKEGILKLGAKGVVEIDDQLKIILGSDAKKLKKYIDNNDLENVKLLGYQENPYKYIKKADIFVCSSRAEGFSTVVSEAVILGKTIVTTECSGMREILGKNAEYGIICKNEEKDLYENLKRVLENKKIFEYYQNKIKERKNFFDMKNNIEKIEKIFQGDKNE